MKSFKASTAAVAAVTIGSVSAIEAGTTILAIEKYQVNNRTLLNDWELDLVYYVDAMEDQSASKNMLTIEMTLRNANVRDDFKRKIKDKEIFQMWFSMADPNKKESVTVQVPAPTADLEEDIQSVDVSVQFFENFVCSLTADETTKNLDGEPFPDTPETLHTF